MTPTTYGRDFAYCLKSHGGVRGFNASLWRFLLRCTLFCHSVATFLTSVSSYEGGCGFEDNKTVGYLFLRLSSSMNSFRMNKFLMFFNIVKIYQSTQAVLNLAVFQSSFLYKDEKRK